LLTVAGEGTLGFGGGVEKPGKRFQMEGKNTMYNYLRN